MATWILLRGLTRESGHWGRFVDELSRALPDARVLALDLPGNGMYCQERSPSQVQAMVAHCRQQLAALQVAPPYHVLAMSLGGMVAVDWAHRHADEIAAQVLINTSLRPFSPLQHRLRPGVWATVLKLACLGGTPLQWEQHVLRLTSRTGRDDVLPSWLALRREHPVSRANALRQLLAAARYRAAAVQPPVPTLVLTSAQDQLVDCACSRTLARHWDCPLRVHPSAGHDLPLDDASWVAAQVREWVMATCHQEKAHEVRPHPAEPAGD